MPLILIAIILPIIAIIIIYKAVRFFYRGVKVYEENKEEDKEWAKLKSEDIDKEATKNN